MNRLDPVEAQLEATREQVEQLRSELRASERHLARVLELLDNQQAQIVSQQASIARLDRNFMELTTGRVWRTLRAAGEIAKRVLPGGQRDDALSSGQKNTYLVCDEPRASDSRPRSGMIAVRGWCLAQGGVDVVQLEAPGLAVIEVKPSIPRPDVKKSHPNLDTSGRAGFAMEFDSTVLAKGRHPLTLRLLSHGEVVRETKTFVEIDHEKGFASAYDRWIHEFENPDNDLILLKLKSFAAQPLISIIMPVYNPVAGELTAAIESVLGQSYERWELCVADDCSDRGGVREILSGFAAQDSRIKVTYGQERGGISRASNAAWATATGDYVCFLDNDDILAPHALAYICEALSQNSGADLLYSDEDKIGARGQRLDPFFKPDWSPDLLLSENYMCHLLVIAQDLAQKTGLFDPAFDGSQDYDLILRATEQARRIVHIPKILYHWRAGAASTASSIDNKHYALDAAQRAIARRHRVEPGLVTGRWRVRYPIPEGSRASIIIASGGRVDALRTNLESLFGKTTYRDYEVVITDNSKGQAIERLVREFQMAHPNLRYLDARDKPFNFSAINNQAAKECDSSALLFLNDDTSVIVPGWLEAMLELALRPEAGAVGAKLLYPNGAIQHAGVVLGLYDNCGHAFKGLDGSKPHYFDFTDIIRNVSAVTGACLMVRANVFWQAGGFDEDEFAVAFNDVDFCLKLSSLGYQNLYTPHAVLYHHESLSKTSKDLIPHPKEVAAMRLKWGKTIAHDPFYNPNLTRNQEDYSLRTRN
jgi:GT2 family glycosyltransferase